MNICNCVNKKKVKSEANGISFEVCSKNLGGCGLEIDPTVFHVTVDVPIEFINFTYTADRLPKTSLKDLADALDKHEADVFKRLGLIKYGPCEYGGCGKDGICSHQNTQYNDEKSNYNTLCEHHQELVDEHWKEMWDSYYAGCL